MNKKDIKPIPIPADLEVEALRKAIKAAPNKEIRRTLEKRVKDIPNCCQKKKHE